VGRPRSVGELNRSSAPAGPRRLLPTCRRRSRAPRGVGLAVFWRVRSTGVRYGQHGNPFMKGSSTRHDAHPRLRAERRSRLAPFFDQARSTRPRFKPAWFTRESSERRRVVRWGSVAEAGDRRSERFEARRSAEFRFDDPVAAHRVPPRVDSRIARRRNRRLCVGPSWEASRTSSFGGGRRPSGSPPNMTVPISMSIPPRGRARR
jgi:hypothetical protein